MLVEFAGSREEAKLIISDLYKFEFNDPIVNSSHGEIVMANVNHFFTLNRPQWTKNGLAFAQTLTRGLPTKLACQLTSNERQTLKKKPNLEKKVNANKQACLEMIKDFKDDSALLMTASNMTTTKAFPFTSEYVFYN